MLELTGMGTVLRAIGWLYWLLAIGAIWLALTKCKTLRAKIIWATVAVVLFGFLPGKAMIEQYQRDAYAKEAWAYFKKKCDTEAGEKIYKTYTGVKSVLVVKPLPPATEKDLFDQFWYGDPYSDATPWKERGPHAAGKLVYPNAPVAINKIGKGFDFVESYTDTVEKQDLVKYYYASAIKDYRQQPIDKFVSRIGISWDDISIPDDRKYWVAGSRLRVIDLADNSVVAERIGYLIETGFGSMEGQRRPWLTARGIGPNGRSCPETHTWSDRWFLLKALKPELEGSDGK
jgi:hypothetical protein